MISKLIANRTGGREIASPLKDSGTGDRQAKNANIFQSLLTAIKGDQNSSDGESPDIGTSGKADEQNGNTAGAIRVLGGRFTLSAEEGPSTGDGKTSGQKMQGTVAQVKSGEEPTATDLSTKASGSAGASEAANSGEREPAGTKVANSDASAQKTDGGDETGLLSQKGEEKAISKSAVNVDSPLKKTESKAEGSSSGNVGGSEAEPKANNNTVSSPQPRDSAGRPAGVDRVAAGEAASTGGEPGKKAKPESGEKQQAVPSSKQTVAGIPKEGSGEVTATPTESGGISRAENAQSPADTGEALKSTRGVSAASKEERSGNKSYEVAGRARDLAGNDSRVSFSENAKRQSEERSVAGAKAASGESRPGISPRGEQQSLKQESPGTAHSVQQGIHGKIPAAEGTGFEMKAEKAAKKQQENDSKNDQRGRGRNSLKGREGLFGLSRPASKIPAGFSQTAFKTINAGESDFTVEELNNLWEQQSGDSVQGQEEEEASRGSSTGSMRLGQIPIANATLRTKILPGLTKSMLNAASEAKKSPENWQKHNFVLDDGKKIQLSVRENNGVLQVKMGSLNGDLSKLLQQNLQQIRDHLKQEFGTEVDLQFEQNDGQQSSETSEDSRSGAGGSRAGGGFSQAATTIESKGNRNSSPARSFGYNQKEWTA